MDNNSGLFEDAPGVDTVDLALEKRAQAHLDRDVLQWLVADSPDPVDQAIPEIRDEDLPIKDDNAPLWKRAAKDAGVGAAEAPRQIVGGLMDAIDSVATLAEKIAPVGGIQVFDQDGNFNLDYVPQDELERRRAAGQEAFAALTPDRAESTTGGMVRSAAQFIGPFSMMSKGLQTAGVAQKIGEIPTAMVAGAGADFLGFKGHEERLSNLIQEYPALQNPVTEYLAADPTDGEAEGRLKNSVEGLGLGFLTDAFVGGVRAVRAARRVASDKNAAKRVAEGFKTMEASPRGAHSFEMLGDAADGAPLLLKADKKKIVKAGKAKMAKAVEESATGVPDDITAKSLTDGLTPLGEGSEVYVNWGKIEAPEDIQRIIDDTATAFVPQVDEARRGVRTNAETALSADKISAWDTLIARRKGDPLNAEQTMAARQLWASSADHLGKVAKVAADLPSPENLYQFRRMLATHHAIQKEVIAARTETARALQIWNVPVGGRMERMRDIEQALDMTGGADMSRELAERVAAIADHPDAAGVISNFAEKSLYAKTRDSIQEYWINALLSGPKTHLVNMMSNASVIAQSIAERATAARINQAIGIDDGVEVGEALAQVHGLISGFGDALRNAAKAAQTGVTGYGVNKIEVGRTRSLSSSAWNIRSNSWVGRAVDTVGAVTNAPGRALQTEDEFFKTLGYRMELHAQAFRQASREVSSGAIEPKALKERMAEIVSNPPESIRLEAAESAAYQTFTNTPGKFAKGVSRILHKYPMARFVIPFLNTPSNILSYTFERTPLAPLTSRFRSAMAEGGAKADIAMARMAAGTGLILYAIDMGMRGQVSGSGPDGQSEKANWRRQGFQPYSVRIGDKWVAYNRLDPLGYTLGIGADIAEFINNADGDEETGAEVQEAIAAAVFSIAENATSKSYMQGASNLLEAINDPDRFAPAYFERFAGSFVPSGVAEVARQMDPKMRVSHDLVSAMKRRTPGFSDDLPPRRDLWGREISYESGLGKVYDALSPLYVSQFAPEPIDLAMERDGWFAGMPSKSLTINGERIGLRNRPEVYSRYLELQGATKPEDMEAYGVADKFGDRTMLEALNDLVEGRSYLSERYNAESDPEEKRDIAMKIISPYRRAARKRLLEEFPDLQDAADRKKARRLERAAQ